MTKVYYNCRIGKFCYDEVVADRWIESGDRVIEYMKENEYNNGEN